MIKCRDVFRHIPRRTGGPLAAHAPPFKPWTIALCATALLAAGLLHSGRAQAAEAVVVASSAPDYKLGQLVSEETPVTLPDGASALFLFASGHTVEVRGPYTGTLKAIPDPPSPGGRTSSLFGGDRFVQSELGAARAFGNPLSKALERASVVDPARAGTLCVKAGGGLMLRRPDDPALSRLRLRDGASGAEATVTWAEGASLAPWPGGLPLRDGAEIAVVPIADGGAEGGVRNRLQLRRMEKAAGSAALAVALASSGCAQQAAAVLASVRDALVPLDLYLSTDRGPAATYGRGDEIRLVLQANRDAHVYCFLRNARGQLIPIFPSAASRTALVEGGVPLAMPGERMPLALRAGDAGEEAEVRCFAASQDLGDPAGPAAEAFRPMTDARVAELDRALSPAPDKEVVMAQVILRVR